MSETYSDEVFLYLHLSGFVGADCSVFGDGRCAPVPCLNQGSCRETGRTGFVCDCLVGNAVL